MGKGKKAKYIVTLLAVLLIIIFVINNAAKLMFPVKYEEYVFKYSREHNIDPYLVFAIIKAESSFNPSAVSHKNARGLMQITEITGEWGAENLGIDKFTVNQLYNPEINIRIGCWYLNRLMKEFNNNIDLVITAYNGGSGNVNEWLQNKKYSNTGESLQKIPFSETDRFLKKVKNYYSIYKKLYHS